MANQPNTQKGTAMNIDKATALAVAEEMRTAIDAILEKHGLQLEDRKIGYGDYFDFKIKAVPVIKGTNGVNMASQEATSYIKFGYQGIVQDGTQFGTPTTLTAELGTIFDIDGVEYVFAGVNPRKRKFPIVAIRKFDGASMGFPDGVINRINASSKAGV